MKRQIFAFSGLFVLILFLSFSSNAFASQYKVKNGDTLYSISKKFGVSIDQIKETNNLKKSRIRKNQILNISTKKSPKSIVKAKAKPAYYTVRKGDTLFKIAKKTHQPMKKIMALNHVNSKSLRVGQKLALAKPVYEPEETTITNKNEELEEDDSSDILSEDGDQDVLNLDQQNEQNRKEELLGKWNSPDEVQLFVKVATGFIGAPYRFGGSTLKGIDCSSFVQKIYRIFDVTLPRNAAQQSKVGINITRENLTEGDLVFFHTNRSLGHVGIYIGNNEFVHASSKSKVVRIDSLDTPYYQKRFQRAVRVKGLDNNGA
ncbi:lipoprotein spr precursor [hydrocarbon metagenome]|uniref:Lipoprotein spr n=1 Tax=hydrocarbon metagenome TaxID=938273 RepID=A0A0W8FNL8_9ZZZZ